MGKSWSGFMDDHHGFFWYRRLLSSWWFNQKSGDGQPPFGCKKLAKHEIPPLKLTARPWKWVVVILLSYWGGLFSGAMLVSGRVNYQSLNWYSRRISEPSTGWLALEFPCYLSSSATTHHAENMTVPWPKVEDGQFVCDTAQGAWGRWVNTMPYYLLLGLAKMMPLHF